MTGMTQPTYPPCPTCSAAVVALDGFGERVTAQPCGHPVRMIVGAGGVSGAIILQPREA